MRRHLLSALLILGLGSAAAQSKAATLVLPPDDPPLTVPLTPGWTGPVAAQPSRSPSALTLSGIKVSAVSASSQSITMTLTNRSAWAAVAPVIIPVNAIGNEALSAMTGQRVALPRVELGDGKVTPSGPQAAIQSVAIEVRRHPERSASIAGWGWKVPGLLRPGESREVVVSVVPSAATAEVALMVTQQGPDVQLASMVQQVDPETRQVGNYRRLAVAGARSVPAYYEVSATPNVPVVLCASDHNTNVRALGVPGRYRVEVTTRGSHLLLAVLGSTCSDHAVPLAFVELFGVEGGRPLAAREAYGLAVLQGGQVQALGRAPGPESATPPKGGVRVPLPGRAVGVAAGYQHALALLEGGRVVAWGTGSGLGDGIGKRQDHPVVLPGLKDVVDVAAGQSYSLALQAGGAVYSWGDARDGRLGVQAGKDQLAPSLIPSLSDVVAIAAGGGHSLALGADGTLWTWGYNGSGQLGLGHTNTVATPTKVTGIKGVMALTASTSDSAVLTRQGEVWSWGRNYLGNFASGNQEPSKLPVKARDVSGAVALSLGSQHLLAIAHDGRVVAAGSGGQGELGNGRQNDASAVVAVSELRDGVAVAGGGGLSFALDRTGRLFVWGRYDSRLILTPVHVPVDAVQLP